MSDNTQQDDWDNEEKATSLRNITACVYGAVSYCSFAFFVFAGLSVAIQHFGWTRLDIKFQSITGESILGWTGYYSALSAFTAVMLTALALIVMYRRDNAVGQIKTLRSSREFKDWFTIGHAAAFALVTGLFLVNTAI